VNARPDSLITFTLSAYEHQTLLTLTHTRISSDEMSFIGAGWHIHIDVLVDRLLGQTPGHFMEAWSDIEPRYRELLQSRVTRK
jgi:hypothetical protein